MSRALQFCLAHLALISGAHASGLPLGHRVSFPDTLYSFNYEGQKIDPKNFLGHLDVGLKDRWREGISEKQLPDGSSEYTFTLTDQKTGLVVTSTLLIFAGNSRAVQWTATFKNSGRYDTPLIENVLAADGLYGLEPGKKYALHHNVGSPADGTDYAPLETELTKGRTFRIAGSGGRPTNTNLSYFDLSKSRRGGEIVGIGWPGQWEASFDWDGRSGLQVKIGQERTHFKLHPGETFRTPTITELSYSGDWIDGQNEWRRWMREYGMPRPGGKLPQQMAEAYTGRMYEEMVHSDEASQLMCMDRYLAVGPKLDYWWMDAGWYVQDQGWPQVGTWEVDRKRFPRGLKPISDHAHANQMKTMVWFEPERVAEHTWLADHHPEWLLSRFGELAFRRSSKLGTAEPFVVLNTSNHSLDWNGIHWEPLSLAFHPGPNGEFSVIRYVARRDGQFKINSNFTGIDQKTTTDVHVFVAGQARFDAFIGLNGHGKSEKFSGSANLKIGQAVDFIVGRGNDHYEFDSTGITATITGPNGDTHDAATEFGSWQYGYLSPSVTPDPTTFLAYDRSGRGLDNGDKLLNLGNPQAWNWLVNHVDKLLVDNGIDLYRQDFNIDPLEFWRSADAPDRQGITENKYLVGYLAYWDELRRRHPNMLIDSCASGGRRNDLETMKRAVPMWRSDHPYEPTSQQNMTYGISMWLPYYGTGTLADGAAPYYGGGTTPVNAYDFWSTACPSLMSSIDIRDEKIDWSEYRRLFKEWRELGPLYYGDYYPLTPFSQSNSVWAVWQFNLADKGEGMIEAFRRPDAVDPTLVVKLRGLQPNARYKLSVVDGAEDIEGKVISGSELMGNGLTIKLSHRPAAAVIKYLRF